MPKEKLNKLMKERSGATVTKKEEDRLRNSLGEEYTPSPQERERIESEKKTYLKSPKEVLKTIKDEVMQKFSGAAVSEPEMEELSRMSMQGEAVGRKKGGMTKAQKKVGTVMSEFKKGKLKSSSGKKVTNPKQAIAIGLSEAGMSKNKMNKGGMVRGQGIAIRGTKFKGIF